MKIAFFGAGGKVGRAVVPVLERSGHEVRTVDGRDAPELDGLDAAVDFTTPEAAPRNVRLALEHGVSCVVGTTGWEPQELGELARDRGLRLLVAPNLSLGAVLAAPYKVDVRPHRPGRGVGREVLAVLDVAFAEVDRYQHLDAVPEQFIAGVAEQTGCLIVNE